MVVVAAVFRRDAETLMTRSMAPAAGIAAALIALAFAIALVNLLRKKNRDSEGSAQTLLAEYRALVARGELTVQEFDAIKNKLLGSSMPPASGQPARGSRPERRDTG